MRVRRLPGTALAGAVAALILAGCSSSGGGGEAAAEETTSPLGVYLDAVYGGDLSEEEQQRRSEDQNRRVEELVAGCMQEQGFEYVPNTATGTYTSGGEEWEPEDREWVAQWGYGAVDWPGRDDVPEDGGEEYVDPNGDYVESLSES
ncbi:hypothetical protein [Klenkia taihuensis]|uniref:hypothetical protein n=1 Tax=Klenkia taihuensis TaxID=1225127 RepID=UPI001987C517|nr:hypothetical protein [Klenkia taihuensis]GHE13437.1 hypothetical protein GCM10011381_35700 [Klenkia taihuensis]